MKYWFNFKFNVLFRHQEVHLIYNLVRRISIMHRKAGIRYTRGITGRDTRRASMVARCRSDDRESKIVLRRRDSFSIILGIHQNT